MIFTPAPSAWTPQQTASFLNGFQIVAEGLQLPVFEEGFPDFFSPAPATAFNAPHAMEGLMALRKTAQAPVAANRMGVSLEIWNDRTNGYLLAMRRNHEAPLILGAWIAFGLSWDHYPDRGSLIGVKASAYLVVCTDPDRILNPALLSEWPHQRAVTAGSFLKEARARLAPELQSSAWEIENWGEPGLKILCPKNRPFAPLPGTAQHLWKTGIRALTAARVKTKG